MIAGERDGWILIAARWPERVLEWIPDKVAQLEDPRVVRLYRVPSELMETDGINDPLAAEAADIMVSWRSRRKLPESSTSATPSATTRPTRCWTISPTRPTSGPSSSAT